LSRVGQKRLAASYDDAEEDDRAGSHDHEPDPDVHDLDPTGEQ
jgi:hypothetical protein